jgi:hypothetical protein
VNSSVREHEKAGNLGERNGDADTAMEDHRETMEVGDVMMSGADGSSENED